MSLCVLGGLSVGVCPPHMCDDGLTCLCHQGSSIITINLGGSSRQRPARGPPPPPESETEEKTEDPSLSLPRLTSPPSPPLPVLYPAASVESTSPHQTKQTHLRRVVKRKKSLKTVMFVNLHTLPLDSFLSSIPPTCT